MLLRGMAGTAFERLRNRLCFCQIPHIEANGKRGGEKAMTPPALRDKNNRGVSLP